MGMDLVPFSKNKQSFHSNWTGWSFLTRSLEIAGADVSKVSYDNDGAKVDKVTALSWARHLQDALAEDKLRMIKIADDRYRGGIHHQVVESDSTLVPKSKPLEDHMLNHIMEF